MTVEELARLPKSQIVELIKRDAEERGRRWALGGPGGWSKDELVAYVVRETDLVQS